MKRNDVLALIGLAALCTITYFIGDVFAPKVVALLLVATVATTVIGMLLGSMLVELDRARNVAALVMYPVLAVLFCAYAGATGTSIPLIGTIGAFIMLVPDLLERRKRLRTSAPA